MASTAVADLEQQDVGSAAHGDAPFAPQLQDAGRVPRHERQHLLQLPASLQMHVPQEAQHGTCVAIVGVALAGTARQLGKSDFRHLSSLTWIRHIVGHQGAALVKDGEAAGGQEKSPEQSSPAK